MQCMSVSVVRSARCWRLGRVCYQMLDDVDTESPRFTRLRQMLRDQHIVQPAGSTVRLRCRADAVPPASVVWIKNGRLLVTSTSRWTAAAGAAGDDDDDDDGEEGDGDESEFALRLTSITAEDGGLYMCRVFNDVGQINFTYTLQVAGLSLLTCLSLHTSSFASTYPVSLLDFTSWSYKVLNKNTGQFCILQSLIL